MRLGILGGTFDPVHYGHLLLAETAREQCRLDQVWLVPAAIPPHKQGHELSPVAERIDMLELAVGGNPALTVSPLEAERGGVAYTVDTLEALMRAFVETGIKPYYLHHGDLAPGTGHLRTTIAQGQALMRALRQRVSGLAMPTYMLDIPGGYGKVPIGPDFVRQRPDGLYAVTDSAGGAHTYEDSVSPSSP